MVLGDVVSGIDVRARNRMKDGADAPQLGDQGWISSNLTLARITTPVCDCKMPDAASVNRSLNTIRTELEFLRDSGIVSPPQFQSIMAQLPVSPSILISPG